MLENASRFNRNSLNICGRNLLLHQHIIIIMVVGEKERKRERERSTEIISTRRTFVQRLIRPLPLDFCSIFL